jgi:hypothetical protein
MKIVDGKIEFLPAKDINIGDTVIGANWDELTPEVEQDPASWSATSMSNAKIVETKIVGIVPSQKDVTMYFNGDPTKRFSLEHTVLVKRDGIYMFIATGTVEVGDTIIQGGDDWTFVETNVDSIDTIDETRTVYKMDAAPTDVIFAGGIVVHNGKVF